MTPNRSPAYALWKAHLVTGPSGSERGGEQSLHLFMATHGLIEPSARVTLSGADDSGGGKAAPAPATFRKFDGDF